MIKNLDLQFIPPSLTAARPPLGSALVSHRYISSSLCSRDASREAESSTSSARVRPAKGDAYLDETKEEAFRRNLREVQAWRRQKEKMRMSSEVSQITSMLDFGSKS